MIIFFDVPFDFYANLLGVINAIKSFFGMLQRESIQIVENRKHLLTKLSAQNSILHVELPFF